MPSGGSSSGLNGFPRGSAKVDLRTRRALGRMAGTTWLAGPGTKFTDSGQLGVNVGAGISINGSGQITAGGSISAYGDGTVPGGNTVANTTTETAFASTTTIAANSMAVGDVFRLMCLGTLKLGVGGTVHLRTKFGSTSMGTGPASASAAATIAVWQLTALYMVTGIGASGSIEADGMGASALLGSGGQAMFWDLSNGAAITVDTTISEAVTVLAKHDTADPTNTITLRQFLFEKLI